MRIAGMSLGVGALYQVLPVKLNAENNEIFNWMGKKNGERPAPFSFVQLSDTQIFAFPDPESTAEKKPLAFDKDHPFRNLGIHAISENSHGEASVKTVELGEVELSLREFSGTEGIQQILRSGVME